MYMSPIFRIHRVLNKEYCQVLHHKSSFSRTALKTPSAVILRTPSPLRLAPVRNAAEINSSSAEVASTAAKASCALLINNRTARLASAGSSRCCSRIRRFGLSIAFAVALLASGATVVALILDDILGAAVAGGGAAAVEVAL